MNPDLPILSLGTDFYSPVDGGLFSNPQLRYRNQKHAALLGLHTINNSEWLQHFGRFAPLNGNLSKPLAMKYHGHQFQNYNPDIGDGRGFVFAQFLNENQLLELGTKGSGITPYSRRGDGRLTLKGAVRELLATDYLEKQRVLTSKTFSIVETDEKLIRHDEPSPTRSAILFRLSRGHIRIGNFQYAFHHQNRENIIKLVVYSLKYFYPHLAPVDSLKEKIELFFQNVTLRLADLCASYMVSGFVHGVLNTDNMNISGESFDYGPYRFLPYYDPYFIAAYFDHEGLYSFGRQPHSFLWNLLQLRQCLLFAEPAADLSKLEETFSLYFNTFFASRFLNKLNLKPNSSFSDSHLIHQFLNLTPDYYDNTQLPILALSHSITLDIQEISTKDFFNKTHLLIENFFKDLYQEPGKEFETAFLEILNWTLRNQSTNYFSTETLHQITTNFTPAKVLQTSQIETREKTLVIDEIEKIWAEIAENDNWAPLEQRLENR